MQSVWGDWLHLLSCPCFLGWWTELAPFRESVSQPVHQNEPGPELEHRQWLSGCHLSDSGQARRCAGGRLRLRRRGHPWVWTGGAGRWCKRLEGIFSFYCIRFYAYCGVAWVVFSLFICLFVHFCNFCSLTLQAQTEHPGDSAHSHRWTSLELVKGTYSTDDSPSDISEIRLDKAVPLKVPGI